MTTILACDDQATTRQYFGKYAGIVVDHGDLATAAGLTEDGRKRGEICVDVPGILEEPDAVPPPPRPPPPAGNGHPPPKQPPPEEPTPRPLRVVAKPSFLPRFFFIPEPGDQVWVEFVAGDIDFPIWTGVWYPKDGAPKTVGDQLPTAQQKVIRTPSGHVLQFDDSNGNILIANSHNTFLSFNGEAAETTLMDEHGNLITMTVDHVLVASKDGTTLEISEGKVKVTAGDTVQIMAQNVVLEAGSVALGSGGPAMTMEPAVLGTTFAQIFNTHTHPTAMGPSGPPIPTVLFGPAPAGQGLSNVVSIAK